MASAKIIFKPSKIYKDGSSPILLQFLVNRVQYTKKIDAVPAQKFDKERMKVKSSFPNYKAINMKLTKTLQDAKSYITKCEIENKPIDPKKYFGKGGSTLLEKLMAKVKVELNRGKIRTSQRWETTANKLEKYDPNIKPSDVDINWIKGFDDYMRSIPNNPNTRARELVNIKRFAREAFENFKMPYAESHKDKLTLSEVSILESANFESGNLQLSLDIFLFALYNRGMRVHNVFTLTHKNIKNGRLIYVMHKGKSDTTKKVNSEMNQKSIDIIEKYKGQSEYIFPLLKMKETNTAKFLKHIDARNTMVRKHLKKICERLGIDKKVTMHTARHSFTHIADVSGVPLRLLQEHLGHSKRETTEIYVKTLRNDEELDDSVRDLF